MRKTSQMNVQLFALNGRQVSAAEEVGTYLLYVLCTSVPGSALECLLHMCIRIVNYIMHKTKCLFIFLRDCHLSLLRFTSDFKFVGTWFLPFSVRICANYLPGFFHVDTCEKCEFDHASICVRQCKKTKEFFRKMKIICLTYRTYQIQFSIETCTMNRF